MTAALEKYRKEQQLDNFYLLRDDEKNNYLKEVLYFANSNPYKFIQYCKSIEPTEFCSLSIIYEALMLDENNWVNFFVEEHQRVFDLAKSKRRPFKSSYCLEVLAMNKIRNKTYENKIIHFLAGEITSNIPGIRLRAIHLLHLWINPDNQLEHYETLTKIRELVHDKNRKVRWAAAQALKQTQLFPKKELRISYIDKIIGRFHFLWREIFVIN